MAAKWNLVCLTCLAALPLGRLVTIDDGGHPRAPYWEGFRNRWDDRWITREELREAMSRFLMIHVGHQLATVDTDAILSALEVFSVGEEPFDWVEDVESLDSAGATGLPEHVNSRLKAELERRLKDRG